MLRVRLVVVRARPMDVPSLGMAVAWCRQSGAFKGEILAFVFVAPSGRVSRRRPSSICDRGWRVCGEL
jgi:hypothetical protein